MFAFLVGGSCAGGGADFVAAAAGLAFSSPCSELDLLDPQPMLVDSVQGPFDAAKAEYRCKDSARCIKDTL